MLDVLSVALWRQIQSLLANLMLMGYKFLWYELFLSIEAGSSDTSLVFMCLSSYIWGVYVNF